MQDQYRLKQPVPIKLFVIQHYIRFGSQLKHSAYESDSLRTG